jgi:hypothetical protein
MANSLKTIYANGKNVMANTTPAFILPNGGGSYANPALDLNAAMGSGGLTPVSPAPIFTGGKPPATTPPPAYTPPPAAPASNTPSNIPKNYINPATGDFYTAKEIVANMANNMPVSKGNGDIGKYAGDVLMNQARGMNNARNDISTGQTDPYDITQGGKVVFSPTERTAIEKAYAGIYDPALNDVFSRLKTAEEQKAADLAQKNKLAEMAQQHIYSMEEKGLTGGSSDSSGAGYIPGADPVVDSYVERINRGELASDVFKNIPGVANQALRNKVSAALMATKYESAKTLGSLDTINQINKLLTNPGLADISGVIDQSGISSLWGDAKTAKTLYNQIAAQMQLQGATLAKGQGAISDYERTIFRDAAVGANRGMSDPEFRQALVNMRGALSLASGLSIAVKLTDPKTGEARPYTLDRDGVIAAEKNGLMVESLDDTVSN